MNRATNERESSRGVPGAGRRGERSVQRPGIELPSPSDLGAAALMLLILAVVICA